MRRPPPRSPWRDARRIVRARAVAVVPRGRQEWQARVAQFWAILPRRAAVVLARRRRSRRVRRRGPTGAPVRMPSHFAKCEQKMQARCQALNDGDNHGCRAKVEEHCSGNPPMRCRRPLTRLHAAVCRCKFNRITAGDRARTCESQGEVRQMSAAAPRCTMASVPDPQGGGLEDRAARLDAKRRARTSRRGASFSSAQDARVHGDPGS